MGGAATYLAAIAREFASRGLDDEFVFVVPPERADQLRDLSPRFRVIATDVAHRGFLERLWFDQVTLRRLLRDERADVLFSTANLGMIACPCRQLLLVRNALYFSRLYKRRFLAKQRWKLRLANAARAALTGASALAADVVMTPSAAMMSELAAFIPLSAAKRVVNHYGVYVQRFRSRSSSELHCPPRLLFTSLYGEHKNLGTLLTALALMAEKGIDFDFRTTADPSGPDAEHTMTGTAEAELARNPVLAGRVDFRRLNPGEDIANLYSAADVLVYPSVVESFGHPLLEAMAAGIPIVAADVPINREVCGDAALYFSPFDATDCATRLIQLLADASLRSLLIARGQERVRGCFTWDRHVSVLLQAFRNSAAAVR